MIRRQPPANVQSAARRLPAVRERVKSLGLPLSGEDVRRLRPPVPPGQNAAPLYREMTVRFEAEAKRANVENPEWFKIFAPGRTRAHGQAARAALADGAEILRLGRLATERPRCDFERPWEKGGGVLVPEHFALRYLVRLLCAQAVLAVLEDGKPLVAVEALTTAGKVIRHLDDPMILAFLVRLMMLQTVIDPFLDVLDRFGYQEEPLTAIERTAPVFANLTPVSAFLRGDVWLGIWIVEQYRSGGQSLEDLFGKEALEFIPTKLTEVERRVYADAMEARHLEFYAELFEECAKPGQTLNTERRFARELIEDRQRALLAGDRSHLLSAVPTFIIPGIYQRAMTEVTYIRLRRVVVAALRGYNRTGRFPKALPAEFNDPFNDRPLGYEADGDRFVAYSVGADGRDDGGVPGKDVAVQFQRRREQSTVRPSASKRRDAPSPDAPLWWGRGVP